MLGRMFTSDCKEAVAQSSFIDRNGRLFEWVIDALRDGICRYPTEPVEAERVHAEYVYFGLVDPAIPSPPEMERLLIENQRIILDKEELLLTCLMRVADFHSIVAYVTQFPDVTHVTSIQRDRILIQYRNKKLAPVFELTAKQCLAWRHASDNHLWRFLWWRPMVSSITPDLQPTDLIRLELASHVSDNALYEPICCRMTVYDSEYTEKKIVTSRCTLCASPK